MITLVNLYVQNMKAKELVRVLTVIIFLVGAILTKHGGIATIKRVTLNIRMKNTVFHQGISYNSFKEYRKK